MDNFRWAPKWLGVGTAWTGTAAAVVWALLATAPTGRVLAVAAAAMLACLAVIGTVARPRLAADGSGLTVTTVRGRRYWSWSQVQRVEMVTVPRLGRRPEVLELDTVDPDGCEHLLILTRLDLGEDPHEVGEQLRRLQAKYRV